MWRRVALRWTEWLDNWSADYRMDTAADGVDAILKELQSDRFKLDDEADRVAQQDAPNVLDPFAMVRLLI